MILQCVARSAFFVSNPLGSLKTEAGLAFALLTTMDVSVAAVRGTMPTSQDWPKFDVLSLLTIQANSVVRTMLSERRRAVSPLGSQTLLHG